MPSAKGRIRLARTSWCSRLERSSLWRANSSIASTVSPSFCRPCDVLRLGRGQSITISSAERAVLIRDAIFQKLKRFKQSCLLPPQPPKRVNQRRKPVSLHQSLAGKTQQSCQALGRDSHHTIPTFFRSRNTDSRQRSGGSLSRRVGKTLADDGSRRHRGSSNRGNRWGRTWSTRWGRTWSKCLCR